MAVYSFIDNTLVAAGPGIAASLVGTGSSEEGITIEMNGEKDTMTVGADGKVMHSLSADRSGKVTMRFLQTSDSNALLMAAYDLQSAGSALWAKNTITMTNSSSGDVTTCQDCAFAKKPTLTYSKDGTIREWVFNASSIDSVLGRY
jgi:hypothetical protein